MTTLFYVVLIYKLKWTLLDTLWACGLWTIKDTP